jgi:hypothetical protein
MKLRAFLYAAIIAALPAFAAECMTVDQVKQHAPQLNPPGITEEMDKEETQAFLNAYNSLPPITAREGDHSVVISHPEVPVVIYVYFRDNCAIETLKMPRDFFADVFKLAFPKLEGQKA